MQPPSRPALLASPTLGASHPPPPHHTAAITAGPEGVTSDPTISFEFSTQSGSTNGAWRLGRAGGWAGRATWCGCAAPLRLSGKGDRALPATVLPANPAHAPPTTPTGIRFECRLGDAAGALSAPGVHRDWAECSSPATYDGLPDGGYQFSVRAAGEEQATVRSFTKDTQPPEGAPGDGPESGPGALLQRSSAKPQACAWLAGSSVRQAARRAFLRLLPTHTARHPAFPPSPCNAVAFVNPQTQPSGATPDADARFEFGGSDATGLNFTCTLAATGTVPAQPPVLAGGAKADMAEVALGQPYPCTSPQLFHWLLPGSWSLQVVGRDAAGNAAPPLQAAWTVAFGQAGGLYTRFLRCGA